MIELDFTINIYKQLLDSLIKSNYIFTTIEEFARNSAYTNRLCILRHDVDSSPKSSLLFAKIQNNLNIKGTYYFRIVSKSFVPSIIKEISKLGHEIGYHYEDFTIAKGNTEKAIKYFENNLSLLREFYPVKTICMHGSPMSKWDNKDLWQYYNYKNYDIICEPYLDIDYKLVSYFTDTGRTWDNKMISVRDSVKIKNDFKITSTAQLINLIEKDRTPKKMLMTFHPQRWHNDLIGWSKEFVGQNIKNVIKRFIIFNK